MPDLLNGWIRLEIYLLNVLSPLFESYSNVFSGTDRRSIKSRNFGIHLKQKSENHERSVPRAKAVFSESSTSNVLGQCPVSGFVSEARMGGGPVVLAGKQLSIVYWAMNLLAINRLLQYLTILCCYLTRLGCTRIDFVWFWDFVPRSTLSNIWSVQCPRCVNKICQ